MKYLDTLNHLSKNNSLPSEVIALLQEWYHNYKKAAAVNGWKEQDAEQILDLFLGFVLQEAKQPYKFQPFHQRIRKPIDYYEFGLNFIEPLVRIKESRILNLNVVSKIDQQIKSGDNVILFANHQTELDPQAISLLLKEPYPKLAEEMIFVAGHRVTTDPMAIPFSKGRNLLCINSKKYIEDDPATKQEKQLHNQSTMLQMSQLLSEGGKAIYVAPSGGRDRPNAAGKLEVASFDPQSIELFWLMAQRAEHPTHFYPLALYTYPLLPPPLTIRKKIGEQRKTSCTPLHLAFGQEIDMENFPGNNKADKKQNRKQRAQYIWEQVQKDYNQIAPS